MSFLEFAKRNAYTICRKIDDKYIEEKGIPDYFSSCMPGYMDVRLVKGNNEIVYGIRTDMNGNTLPPNIISNKFGGWLRRSGEQWRSLLDIAFEHLTYDEILQILENTQITRKDVVEKLNRYI